MDTTLHIKALSCRCLPQAGCWQKIGCFFRKSDSKWLQRWRCYFCKKSSSQAIYSSCYRQKKRRVNEPLRKLLCSGVSQRRAAKILDIHPITVARKFKFLALQAKTRQKQYLSFFKERPLSEIQFDEMETHEHSKLKPLSIALVVSKEKRKVLGFRVSEMPAKGVLAKLSRAKYGKRMDDRAKLGIDLLSEVASYVATNSIILSDQNPKYGGWIKASKLVAAHEQVKGRRGCVVGQGELKKIGFDPLFSLNHTAAMFRANVNRLFRKTWCTTKKLECLVDHLHLYMDFHNRELTPHLS